MQPVTANTAVAPTDAAVFPGCRTATGSYFLGTSTFSVYEEMARQLQEEGWVRKTKSAIATADFILGDRFHIPYVLLRGQPMALSSRFSGTRWVNYFEGSHRLTLKAEMVRLLKEVDANWAAWLPESYAVGGDQRKKSDEREALLEALTLASDDDAMWIVKPSVGAKGRDIVLLRAHAVPEWLEQLPESGRRMYVVQRYVDRPLLLSHNRKFDIRVWALLTSPYNIYAYTQASCRTASVPFDVSDITNTYAHLTNHCLQESADHFSEYEEGNEMWLPQLQEYLTSTGKPPDLLETRVLPNITELLVRTLLAIMPEIEVPQAEAYKCFQLFGYDVILTEDFGVRLLEINGSPGIAERFLSPLVRSMRELLDVDPKGDTASTPVSSAAGSARLKERAEGGTDSVGSSHPVNADGSDSGKQRAQCVSTVTSTARVTPTWRLKDEGFVLLWHYGDAVPPGLKGVPELLH